MKRHRNDTRVRPERPKQVWETATGEPAKPKGEKGAVPMAQVPWGEDSVFRVSK